MIGFLIQEGFCVKLRGFFLKWPWCFFCATVSGRCGWVLRHLWCYHCCFAGAPAFHTALLLRLPICLYLLLCCCFLVALLLLRCLSPGLPEIEGIPPRTKSAKPPCLEPSCPRLALDRPVLDQSAPEHTTCRGFLFPLPQKQFIFLLSLGALHVFTLSFLVLTHLRSLCPLLKPPAAPPSKPPGLNKKTQRAPNVHFERPCCLQTPPKFRERENKQKRQQERRDNAKCASEGREQKSTKCWAPTPDRPTGNSAGFLLLLLLLLCCCCLA